MLNCIISDIEELVTKGENEKFKLLLQQRPDIIVMRGSYNRTPLLHAAAENNLEVLKLLLERGESFNARSGNGSTVLHIAVSKNSGECIIWLLDNCPLLLNETDKDGDTPLHCAACFGRLNSLKLLLHGGAKIHVRNNKGKTALQEAEKRQQTACMQGLQNWYVLFLRIIAIALYKNR